MPVTNYYTVNNEVIAERTAGSPRVDYLTDALGSVTATVNQSAQVVNTYRYKPHGALLAKTGTGADPAFGWNGSHGYRPTGMKFSDFYVRARHDDSTTGRWGTIDLLWPKEPAYVYALAAPTQRNDPSGLGGTNLFPCGNDDVDCCTESDREICDKALIKLGLPDNIFGTTICCPCPGAKQVRKIACTFPTRWGGPGPLPPPVLDCLQEHENCHLPAAACGPMFGLGGMPGYKGRSISECWCNLVNLNCLLSAMYSACNGLPLGAFGLCALPYLHQIDVVQSEIQHYCADIYVPEKPPTIIKPMAAPPATVRLALQRSSSNSKISSIQIFPV